MSVLSWDFVDINARSVTYRPGAHDKKYPFAKTGYETYDEGNFFYYMSLAQKTQVDEEVVNTLYRMVIDGTFLQLFPPMAVFGEQEVGTSIQMPGTVTAFQNPDSKAQRIDVANDLSSGSAVLNRVEDSISESSQSVFQLGQSPRGSQTAFEISKLDEKERVQLGLFGKMIGFLVKEMGDLMINDILQFLTVGEVIETLSGANKLKFRTFLLPEKQIEGTAKTRKIVLDGEMADEMTEKEIEKASMDLLQAQKPEVINQRKIKTEMSIAKVNPTLFRNLKFKIRVSPDIVIPPSDNVSKALNLEAYDRMIQNPLANQEQIFRDLLLGSYSKTKDDPDKYIQSQQAPGLEQLIGAGAGRSPVEAVNRAERGQV